MKRVFLPLIGAAGLWLFQPGGADVPAGQPLPAVAADAVAIAPHGLRELHRFMQRTIDAGTYAGAVTLIARDGKIVDWSAFGFRDVARRSPLPRDAIFRIYSMTKTVTSVAVLMLVEEGRIALEDPVARYLPEFAGTAVYAGGSADSPRTRAPQRPITIRNLLTHTSGFAVGGDDPPQAVTLLAQMKLDEAPDLREYCRRLARVPLATDPGSRFNYDGVQIVVLSRLVEVVSGLRFDEFLERRIFSPLNMRDTGFTVPAAQRARIVEMTATDDNGKLVTAAEYRRRRAGEMLNPYFSGAGGLYSTAGDFARFSQMLLNGGELDGSALLRGQTVRLMLTNQLDSLPLRSPEFRPGEGFGLGGYVVLDPERRGRPGSAGQFGWSGAASTYYAIDPKERLLAILLLQHLPRNRPTDPPKLNVPFYNLVYQSLLH